PLAMRERVAFAGESLIKAAQDLKARVGEVLCESAILSTCNRTEIYGATPDPQQAGAVLEKWIAAHGGLKPNEVRSHTYTLPGDQTVRHAFRVASGLDSMVLGEAQILGQMKDAVRTAHEAGSLGPHLHQLFQRSFAVAKEVRTQTDIGSQSVSLAAAAVRLAERIFERIEDTRVLFVGAGEMIELAATHFAARRPKAMLVANRNLDRAQQLGRRFAAQSMANRRQAASQAEAIIEARVEHFMHWLARRRAVPAIQELHDKAQALRRLELERAMRQLAKGDDPAQVIEGLSLALTAKFLHGPTQMLQDAAGLGSEAQESLWLPNRAHGKRLDRLHRPSKRLTLKAAES
ncbi:MAG: glutamyl-tRNA reductase, partial [Betaproteobacteria bacterium]|nr:glutamyl-tRNA reductase [Betaproteobacteria bacterium]